jgi:hypothetical protein
MDNTYYLDLATLLKTLANISAILAAELPDGIPNYREPCKGYIRVHNNVISMSIIMSNGKIIAEGVQALQFLQSNKAWHVSFSPDLLDNAGPQQASSSASQSLQRPTSTSAQPQAHTNQSYLPAQVQYSPTTGPLSPQPTPPIKPGDPPTTEPLSPHDPFFSRGQPYLPSSTQSEIPVVGATGFILDNKIFQQRAALSTQLLGGYNTKERLILRTLYAKVNGQRRVDQLKDELRLPIATVERALWELYRLGVID